MGTPETDGFWFNAQRFMDIRHENVYAESDNPSVEVVPIRLPVAKTLQPMTKLPCLIKT